jgi:hypothetical protein
VGEGAVWAAAIEGVQGGSVRHVAVEGAVTSAVEASLPPRQSQCSALGTMAVAAVQDPMYGHQIRSICPNGGGKKGPIVSNSFQ